MKILQINSVCGYGSTGRIAVDLYKVYEEAGHECVIAYGRGTAPEGIKTIKIGTDLDVYMHVAKTRLLDKHGFGSKKATEKFIEKVREYNPDVIHLHNIHGYYINIEVLFNYIKEENKKIIWTLHDCWALTGHCAYFDYVGCDKWINGCSKCPQKKEYPTSSLLDKSEMNYKKKKNIFSGIKDMTIITPSNWLGELVKKSYLKKYQVRTIYNGIDIKIFQKKNKKNLRMKYGIQDKKIILGVANVWEKRKGLQTFIELNEVLNEEWKIVLVGLNQEQIKKLPDNIIGISRTDSIEELAEIYENSDIYINASYEETMGLTTVEAMAVGTPVIVRNKTAIPEIVNEKCGYKFNNIEELIEIIKSFDYDYDWVINCRNEAKKFDKNKIIKKYLMYV